jgi:hypothetical protein
VFGGAIAIGRNGAKIAAGAEMLVSIVLAGGAGTGVGAGAVQFTVTVAEPEAPPAVVAEMTAWPPWLSGAMKVNVSPWPLSVRDGGMIVPIVAVRFIVAGAATAWTVTSELLPQPRGVTGATTEIPLFVDGPAAAAGAATGTTWVVVAAGNPGTVGVGVQETGTPLTVQDEVGLPPETKQVVEPAVHAGAVEGPAVGATQGWAETAGVGQWGVP